MTVEAVKGRNRIRVYFPYSRADTDAMKQLGAQFNKGSAKAGKYWSLPLDLATLNALTLMFGERLQTDAGLVSWSITAKKRHKKLIKRALSATADLPRLKSEHKKLYEAVFLGPAGKQMDAKTRRMALKSGKPSYQTADVRHMADAKRILNTNQPGLGKTIETIAAVHEAGNLRGMHLVICPATAIDSVWEDELEAWQDLPVFACTGSRAQRDKTIAEFFACDAPGKWLVINPQMLAYRKDANGSIAIADAKGWCSREDCREQKRKREHVHYSEPFPEIAQNVWTNVIADEVHKGSVRNHKTITAIAMNAIVQKRSGLRFGLSGTPMKQLGADIWGILNWLDPETFSSYWAFATRYFEIFKSDFGQTVGPLRKEMQTEFFEMLTPYLVRRTKAECLPWLPPKQHISVSCRMEGKQLKQYREIEENGMANVGGAEIATTSLLAEYVRQSQFAIAHCTLNADGKVAPTNDSCKLRAAERILDERGIFADKADEKVVIFSQYAEVVQWVAAYLAKKKVRVEVLTGKENKKGQRREIKNRFQEGNTQVLCVVTTAGGVAITLDKADTAIFFDDMWSPDDQEQAEDRIHRASRIHQVTIYHLRTEDSLDQYRVEAAGKKSAAHADILDVRRVQMAALAQRKKKG